MKEPKTRTKSDRVGRYLWKIRKNIIVMKATCFRITVRAIVRVYIYGTFLLFSVTSVACGLFLSELRLGSLTLLQTELTQMKDSSDEARWFCQRRDRIYKVPVIVERAKLLLRFDRVCRTYCTYCTVLYITADTGRFHSTREKRLARERKTNSQFMAGECPSG